MQELFSVISGEQADMSQDVTRAAVARRGGNKHHRHTETVDELMETVIPERAVMAEIMEYFKAN